MRKSVIVIASAFMVGSIAANADFSTSEFGSGAFSTGDGSPITTGSTPEQLNNEICGEEDCPSGLPAAFTALGNAITADGSTSSSGSTEQDAIVNFFDSDQDGSVTASEVIYKYGSISGVSFTSVSTHQAGALLRGMGTHCSTEINEACLTAAANDADTFVADALDDTSNLGALLSALEDSTSDYAVADTDPLAVFDTDYDGEISDSEIVNLLALDGTGGSGVDTSQNGLFARAYIAELNGGSSLSDAVSAGNSWAVYPPSIGTVPSISMSGTSTSSQTSSAIPVYDGSCDGTDLTACTTAPANVSHTVEQTHTPLGGSASSVSGTLFTVNSSGQITLADGVNIEDLSAGTYNLAITSTDDNSSQSYNRTMASPASATLTVSNEDGCIMSTDVANSDFNATGSIVGAAVTISGGHDSSYDKLFIKGATSSFQQSDGSWSYTNIPNPSGSGTLSGITARYVPSAGMLRFYGTRTKDQWVALFDSVGFIYNNSGSTSQKNLIFSLSNKVPYLHDNNTTDTSDDTYHFYDYIAYGSGENRNHTNAITTTQGTSLMGLTGYLATITSQAEQDYVNPKVQGHGWLGACDDLGNQSASCNGVVPTDSTKRDEGEWYWIDGPEKGGYIGRASGYASNPAGQSEWNNGSWDSTGATYSYTNWANNEPNNVSGGCTSTREDALHVWSWRKWNDYCRSNGNIQGYLIEWGGPADTSWGQVNSTPISFTTTKNYNPATQGTFCAHQ